MNVRQFVEKHRVRMGVEWIAQRPDGLMDDMPAGSRHYRCVLRKSGRRMTVYFSCGPAIEKEPAAADVLGCLASDASGVDTDFEEWCSELGLNTDSRKAERIYKATVKSTESLKRLLNGSFEALMECERL